MINRFNPINSIRPNTVIWLIITAIISWLTWGALVVGVETADGYLTLKTAQYFLGLNQHYGFQRGPFLALYLLPAEWSSNFLNLHPLDVRPHHILTALLNSIYLVLIWVLLKQYYQKSNWLLAVAFLATIPSFIFFSYGVFISSDIMPGVLLLGMILIVFKYVEKPNLSSWLALIAIGFVSVTIKQTYAIFWISILIASLFFYPKKITLHLFFAACISAILSWLAYAWFLNNAIPAETPWWKGPYELITFVKNLYADQGESLDELFVWWLYIRNYYNYGLLTSTLILPSIIYVLFFYKSKTNHFRVMAAVWIICITFMQTIAFKEVRYLAFLAPLSAFLLVPFFHAIYDSKYSRLFIFLIVASFSFDIIQNTSEATRINNRFYQDLTKNYLKPLDDMYSKYSSYSPDNPKIVMINSIGLTPNIFSPLKSDRFHRTFHLPNNILPDIYSIKNIPYLSFDVHLNNIMNINVHSGIFSPGDLLIFSNQNIARQPPFDDLNKPLLNKNYLQFIGEAEIVKFVKDNNQYIIQSDESDLRPTVLFNDKDHEYDILLGNKTFSKDSLLHILNASTIEHDEFEILAFKIRRLCNNTGCYNVENNVTRLF